MPVRCQQFLGFSNLVDIGMQIIISYHLEMVVTKE